MHPVHLLPKLEENYPAGLNLILPILTSLHNYNRLFKSKISSVKPLKIQEQLLGYLAYSLAKICNFEKTGTFLSFFHFSRVILSYGTRRVVL
jgi:hypothetical protein